MKQGNLVTFYKFNISENNQEIVSKSRLMASRPGSRRRPVAGPVGGLNQWVDARRQRIRPDVISEIVATRVLLNIDMHNTFNSLRRESFISVARVRTPGLCSLLWQVYSSQTRSFFGEEEFASETGIQQGATIGPAFFALSVDEAARGVQSELNVRYFNDSTMLPSKTTRRGVATIWWYYWRGSEQLLAWRSMGANMTYATRQCVQYSLSR